MGNYEVDMIKYTVGCGDLVIGELLGQCVLYEIKQAGSKISVVETQGSIKNSILCPPGPHALLLVSPVNRDEELLPGHFWKHTIALFACDDGVGELAIKACIQKSWRSAKAELTFLRDIVIECQGKTLIQAQVQLKCLLRSQNTKTRPVKRAGSRNSRQRVETGTGSVQSSLEAERVMRREISAHSSSIGADATSEWEEATKHSSGSTRTGAEETENWRNGRQMRRQTVNTKLGA